MDNLDEWTPGQGAAGSRMARIYAYSRVSGMTAFFLTILGAFVGAGVIIFLGWGSLLGSMLVGAFIGRVGGIWMDKRLAKKYQARDLATKRALLAEREAEKQRQIAAMK